MPIQREKKTRFSIHHVNDDVCLYVIIWSIISLTLYDVPVIDCSIHFGCNTGLCNMVMLMFGVLHLSTHTQRNGQDKMRWGSFVDIFAELDEKKKTIQK